MNLPPLTRDIKFLILSIIIFCAILLLMLLPFQEPFVAVPPSSYEYSDLVNQPGWTCSPDGICAPLHTEGN